MVTGQRLTLRTRGNGDVVDVTDEVNQAIQRSGLTNGIVVIFSPSSTSGLTTIEYESGCVADLQRLFDELIPPERDYRHNLRWGDGNGHSHLRAALLKASLTVPFTNRRLTLGTWQQIVFVDFDVRPRQRELVIQMLGE
jgi:secondary thiamine-phosphate synthase enzyme